MLFKKPEKPLCYGFKFLCGLQRCQNLVKKMYTLYVYAGNAFFALDPPRFCWKWRFETFFCFDLIHSWLYFGIRNTLRHVKKAKIKSHFWFFLVYSKFDCHEAVKKRKKSGKNAHRVEPAGLRFAPRSPYPPLWKCL